jgi:ribosomal protein S18 acetylase RimI-like enzyme
MPPAWGTLPAVPTLRPAVVADVPAVVDLWDRAAGPTRHAGGELDTIRLLERDPGALIVAVDGDTIVGTLVVGWDGWRAHLYRLCVEPAARRRGIARALVDAAARRAVALGAVRLDAMVHAHNAEAVGFWAAAGFTVEGDDQRWSLLPRAPAAGA